MPIRIKYLDGFRGVAILMVVFFHAFARWPGLLPYGDRYEFFFEYFVLGVQLFFLISGFVILMTLEKCSSFREFLLRRWLRLFPAMLVCSLVIYATSDFFYERPAGEPDLYSLMPGLLFIEPSWLSFFLGRHISPLEGAFWSIYVEFKFYVLAGFVYFYFGRSWMMYLLVILCTIGFLFKFGWGIESSNYVLIQKVVGTLSFHHFGWFSAGAFVYIYVKENSFGALVCAFVMCVYSSVFYKFGDVGFTVSAMLMSFIFLISAFSERLARFFEFRFFVFLGFISYPLYLLHENILVASIVKISQLFDGYQYLYPAVPVIALCFVSYVLARYVEPNIKLVISDFVFRR